MSLKQNILALLEANRDADLSGQALAERFGVSRSAVWKAITALREDGHEIGSAPNRGYRLSAASDRLSEASIAAFAALPGLTIHRFDALDSTNNEAKRRLASGEPEPFLVVAEEQTAGRGRRGRSFFSPKGAGLYMTLALPPAAAQKGALSLTAYAAVCVAEALATLTGVQARIKWVNDLFLQNRKICGILTEAVTDIETGDIEALLVGVGINLRPSAVPEALSEVIGFVGDPQPLKNRLAADITRLLLQGGDTRAGAMDRYRSRCLTLGRRVQCEQGGERFTGTATDIAADGGLVVTCADGSVRTLRSGEALLLPPDATA